jgi:hypothetical protein
MKCANVSRKRPLKYDLRAASSDVARQRLFKVPSLRGVWYRNAFGHMGQAETLDEWFDPERLDPATLQTDFIWRLVRSKATNLA